MKSRDSRGLIAAAARSEFAAHGYAGARVDRIARRAGVNKQLLFYYFGSKKGLYQKVVEGAAGEATKPTESAKPSHAAAQLRHAFNGMFDLLSARPDVARLLLFDNQQTEAGPSRQALQDLVARIRDVITEGQGHGYFRDDIDPDRTAKQALVLAVGYFALEPVFGDAPAPGRIADWRDGALDLLLRALAW
ncbi:MAG: TetR/AcrR family transcriptional regulator [Gemmatimonadetes bacterium]|nr:TetR/AcrR family transcriptional regulator [Gemmatimonadota bacterium]